MILNIETIIRKIAFILLFISLFFFVFLLFLMVKIVIVAYFPEFIKWMFYLRSVVILWGKARLNYIGFCFPLVTSGLLFYLTLRLEEKKIHSVSILLLSIVLISALYYSLFFHELRTISSNGGGVNWLAFVSVLGFITYLILRGIGKQGAYISFILGFIVGAISDLESLTHTVVATTYGAGGIFDADFILPFSMMLAYMFLIKLDKKQR